LRHGEVVALVGRTGSGKTTIGALLTRAYDGYGGQIRIDGHELRTLKTATVRRAIAAVRQDPQLFPESVRFNLTLGADIPDELVLQIAQMARAERVIQRLGGLDAQVAQGGANLSVGECQLLAMARVLLHDPAVVVLDEATASVDSVTEALLQQATAEVLQRKTCLVIAHRLSTILAADRIVLLDGGRVVEMGPHAQLLALNGAYASLFREQEGAWARSDLAPPA
jgi:ABC-type multidrug transport system fused ATPase/permease subunit